MANYKLKIKITNSNTTAITCNYGFSSTALSNSVSIASETSTEVEVETDLMSGTFYAQFSASGYTDSDIASITFNYNPLADLTIAITSTTGSTEKSLTMKNCSPSNLSIEQLDKSSNIFFGLAGNNASLNWSIDAFPFTIKSNQTLTIVSVDSATSQTYDFWVESGSYTSVEYTNV